MKRAAPNGVTTFYGVHAGTREAADLTISVKEPINDLFAVHLTQLCADAGIDEGKDT